MSENQPRVDTSTELARERNREASDRMLMAWIRTGLSLISFGFGIGKFYNYLETAELDKSLDPLHSTQLIGGALIGLGVLGLFAAVVQHRRILKRIAQFEFVYVEPLPLGMIMAILLLLIGVFAFLGILL
jgi:uncharacterized membrane protein YidH (DUF202 family)